MTEQNEKTIAAIATPAAAGGIGIIRISGADAIKIAGSVFRAADDTPISSLDGYSMKYGRVYDGETLIDEAIALVFRAPKSYTGEDVAELSCHGGIYILKRVLRAVIEKGAYPAAPGEFTKRAFLNGKTDLTQAQSVMDLISAQGEQAARGAAAAREGAISKQIEKLKSPLVKLSAHIGAWVDYPDEDIPELGDENILSELYGAHSGLKNLLKSFDAGKILCGGISTAIVGRPNVGKSTLMNLLTRAERSIVTPIAGTTRDIVEENICFGNLLLRLADTAGIHTAGDEVEQIGVDRAKERIKNADLVLAVFDSSQELNDDDLSIISLVAGKKSVAIVNKTDLEAKIDTNYVENHFKKTVYMSTRNDGNCEALEKVVEELFELNDFDTSNGILNSELQRRCCVRALECIGEAIDAVCGGMTLDAVNISIDCAIEALMELTGEKPTVEITEALFANFCIGK